MQHFGDPTFAYHAALARLIGTIALRLDEADILPYDFAAYAAEIAHASNELASRAFQENADAASVKSISEASAQLNASASRVSQAIQVLFASSLNATKEAQINRALAAVEQSLLTPEGLVGRPWYKHTVFAPGSYAGYAAGILPGPNEALDRKDAAAFRREAESLAAALRRAATSLDNVTRLAQP